MHPTHNLATSTNNRYVFRIIHQISQPFHGIYTLAKQNRFGLILKWILISRQILIIIIFILSQSIFHQKKPLSKLVSRPQTNLSIFKILNLDLNLILHIINIIFSPSKYLPIIKLTFQYVSKLDIFIQ